MRLAEFIKSNFQRSPIYIFRSAR